MLETKCVPSVRSILFIAILTKILGKAIFDSSIGGRGNARQYSQAIGLSDRGEFTFGDWEPPKNHRMGEGAQHTTFALPSPSTGKARAGFRSSAPGAATAVTGRSNPPGPHSGSRGLVWKDGWLGTNGSLRPGSKEDAELSLQLPPHPQLPP